MNRREEENNAIEASQPQLPTLEAYPPPPVIEAPQRGAEAREIVFAPVSAGQLVFTEAVNVTH